MPLPIPTLCRSSVAAILTLGLMLPIISIAADKTDPSIIAEGKAIAFDRKKGNCLACHTIEDGELPGNQGPPLVAMKQRFPDKSVVRDQIWDATVKNPQSMMPPFRQTRHSL